MRLTVLFECKRKKAVSKYHFTSLFEGNNVGRQLNKISMWDLILVLNHRILFWLAYNKMSPNVISVVNPIFIIFKGWDKYHVSVLIIVL